MGGRWTWVFVSPSECQLFNNTRDVNDSCIINIVLQSFAVEGKQVHTVLCAFANTGGSHEIEGEWGICAFSQVTQASFP